MSTDIQEKSNKIRPIKLTKKQTQFFNAVFDGNMSNFEISSNKFREFASFGGFGSAKSFIVMLSTLLICLKYPRTRWLYARATYVELKGSVIPQFKEAFPPDTYGYVHKIGDKEFHFSNGSVINFMSFDMPEKIFSYMYHGASLCQAEEMPEDLVLQLWGRTRLQKNGIKKNIIMLEGNPSSGWAKTRYKDNPLPDNVFFIESTTFDNPYNPEGYIDQMVQNFPDFWVRRYIYGEWGSFDEMVFSEFRPSVHVIDPFDIPEWYKRVNGFDYGWRNPSAIVFMAKDDEGNIYVYDEFKEAEKLPSELAKEANRHGKVLNVIDPSTKTPDRDGKDVFTELLREGLHLLEANKSKMQNILLVNSMLKNKKMFIFRNCAQTIEEMNNYKWKKIRLGENKNLSEDVIKKNDHAMDALMYATQYIADAQVVDPVKKAKEEAHFDVIFAKHYADLEMLKYG